MTYDLSDKLIIKCISYLFSNSLLCHWLSHRYKNHYTQSTSRHSCRTMNSAELNLHLTTQRITLVSLSALIIFGLFGSLCNILIFTSRTLRKNACAFYFLCTAVFEFVILCFGAITRLATENLGSTLLHQNRLFCKIRSYLITSFSSITPYFIVLACIDRCLVTSTRLRYQTFNHKKLAYLLALLTTLIGLLINSHTLVLFDLQPMCIPQPGSYSLFYSIYLIIFNGVVPNCLILGFSLRTIHNVKRARARVNVLTQNSRVPWRGLRKTEAQLVSVSYLRPFFDLNETVRIHGLDDARPGIFLIDHRYTTCLSVHLLLCVHG